MVGVITIREKSDGRLRPKPETRTHQSEANAEWIIELELELDGTELSNR